MTAGNGSVPRRVAIDPSLTRELRSIVGADAIVSRVSELKVYECDGWTIEKSAPDLLVMPRTTE
jgi:glycolate oxidase